ncbi:MAG: hypothetical protein NT131_04210 [Methanomassiliicoccales archaeon]|nr:hypothetical protein [Methanomassiliicoccales archaeon]
MRSLTDDTEVKEEGPRERVLMCAADWKDPDCRTIIDEFHKDGLGSEILEVDQDLAGFEKAWGDKGPAKFVSEYHKEGAPNLEKYGLGDHVPTPGQEERPKRSPLTFNRTIDLGTAELLTYALFRAVFGYGVNIPIKKEGVVNMDVTIKGRDVTIDTHEFYLMVPDLVVWKVIYSHQGQPIVEFGRGVKKGMKVYRLRALKLFLTLWSQSRKAAKAKAGKTEESAEAKE